MNKKQWAFLASWVLILAIIGTYQVSHPNEEYERNYAVCEYIDFESEECFCYQLSATCHPVPSMKEFVFMILATTFIIGVPVIFLEYLEDDKREKG